MDDRMALVADLHLGAGGGSEWVDAAAAFADFVAALIDLDVQRLLILGDFLELCGVAEPRPGAAERAASSCARILDRVPRIVDALAGFSSAGGHVDVVIGNHDADLVRPDVAARLVERIDGSASDSARVSINPWFLILPGVLYAEHGHQHHDINRFPLVLDPYNSQDRERLHEPPAVALHRTRLQAPIRRADAVWKAAVGAEIREADALADEYRGLVVSYGLQQGLPPEVSLALERMSAFSRVRTARRLALRGLRRQPSDAYLLTAASALHRVLGQGAVHQPLYCFGHTHRMRVCSIGSGATYANPGSWSPLARDPSQRYSWLLVDARSKLADGPRVVKSTWS